MASNPENPLEAAISHGPPPISTSNQTTVHSMKTIAFILLVVASLSSCAGPLPPPILPPLPPPPPIPLPVAPAVWHTPLLTPASITHVSTVARGDYQPHLLRSYRAGYRYGAADRYIGRPRDYRSAFLCSGESWESYFQEGYADGYDLRGEQH